MAALVWDDEGNRLWETGTDCGVLWVYSITNGSGAYENGVAWNGLTGVSDSPEGGDQTETWADNMMYATMTAREKAGGTIKAYTYPDKFAECDGSVALADGLYIGQQERKKFAFSYRSVIGNDVSDEAGYKIHIYYGCACSPSSKDYATINDSPSMIEFSWSFKATPVNVTGHKPCAHVVIDSTKLPEGKLDLIEAQLYGSGTGNTNNSTLLLPDQIKNIITSSNG